MEIEWVSAPDYLTKDPKVKNLIQLVLRKTEKTSGVFTVMCAEKTSNNWELSIWLVRDQVFTSVSEEFNLLSDIKRECSFITDCYVAQNIAKNLCSVYIALINVPPTARSAERSFQQHVAAVNAVRAPERDEREKSPTRDLKKARKKMWEEGGRKEKQRESRDKPPASGSLIGTVGGIFRDALFN